MAQLSCHSVEGRVDEVEQAGDSRLALHCIYTLATGVSHTEVGVIQLEIVQHTESERKMSNHKSM